MKSTYLFVVLVALVGCGPMARTWSVPSAPIVTVSHVQAASTPEDQPDDSQTSDDRQAEQATFWDQAQRLYVKAKDSGTTTASSTADWVAELYDRATTSTQAAGQSSTKWITEKYIEAVASGETTAATARDWVLDDLGKIGTWKYKVVEIQSPNARLVETELSQLGAQRWEGYAVQTQANKVVLYLKRSHRSYLRYLPAKDLFRLVPLLQGDGDAAE